MFSEFSFKVQSSFVSPTFFPGNTGFEIFRNPFSISGSRELLFKPFLLSFLLFFKNKYVTSIQIFKIDCCVSTYLIKNEPCQYWNSSGENATAPYGSGGTNFRVTISELQQYRPKYCSTDEYHRKSLSVYRSNLSNDLIFKTKETM